MSCTIKCIAKMGEFYGIQSKLNIKTKYDLKGLTPNHFQSGLKELITAIRTEPILNVCDLWIFQNLHHCWKK